MSSRPIRAEVVGSLLRQPNLVRARQDHADGRLSTHAFKVIEDRAVDAAIAVQEAAGLDVITDGELRRGIFTGPLTENIDGLEYVPEVTRTWYTPQGPVEEELPVVVTERLRLRRSAVTEEFAYARARARTPVKVTLPSPLMMLLRWSPQHSTAAYRDAFEMVDDAAAIIREEVRELAALGCTYIHIDAPEIATLVQRETRAWYERQGISIDRILTEGLDLLNSVTDVAGVDFGIHLCRGNRHGRWMAAGGYDYVAAALFARCSGFDRFLLEYDDAIDPALSSPWPRLRRTRLLSSGSYRRRRQRSRAKN
ncbi:hypothetical protein ACFTZB_01390 [Rhodococcus sp. NPDC057014]|uniref:hypothetical protein n=1 Tax=Rhodococcus sp. NPDC057014 TaxID=3346000 RepID=UPI00362D5045